MFFDLIYDAHTTPSVLSQAILGPRNLGYNWNYIQRWGESFNKRINLRPSQFHNNGRYRCSCGSKVTKPGLYCSPLCKLTFSAGGGVRAVVTALVNGDYQDISLKDRFCGVCELIYSSEHCADHEGYHGYGAQPGSIVQLIHQDGRIFVLEEQVPPELRSGVMRVIHDDGITLLTPLRRRWTGEDLLVEVPHVCRRPGCSEPVNQGGEACSLECR